jgi:hypothetical protein
VADEPPHDPIEFLRVILEPPQDVIQITVEEQIASVILGKGVLHRHPPVPTYQVVVGLDGDHCGSMLLQLRKDLHVGRLGCNHCDTLETPHDEREELIQFGEQFTSPIGERGGERDGIRRRRSQGTVDTSSGVHAYEPSSSMKRASFAPLPCASSSNTSGGIG